MPEIIVDIVISAQDILQYYKGTIANVSAIALDGRRVQFPVNLLRSFMTYAGVNGRFSITYNENGKFQKISKL
jgi:hypothetical protein